MSMVKTVLKTKMKANTSTSVKELNVPPGNRARKAPLLRPISPARKKDKIEATESNTSANSLKESEARYRRLFETAKDGILILDASTGQITDVNPFLIELLGYSYEELLEKKLWEIGPFKDIVASQEAFEELRQKKYIRYDELPLETKNGARKDVEFVSNVYGVNGKNVIQCNIRDISDRKQVKE